MTATIPTLEGTELAGKRYRLTKRLPGGGMADVYRGWDNNLQTDVIIKIPLPELLKQPSFAARFSREVRSLVRLAHPHIVKVFDVGDHHGVPFAVMQYLTGGSLRDRQIGPDNNVRPLPLASLPGWLPGIAQALDFVHSQKFVHRDVKPANILFDPAGNPFLSDFGVIKTIAAEGQTEMHANLTRQGMVLGTLQYMAPEMFLGKGYDGRIDQYALAVTVYEALAARWPFSGTSPADVMMQQLKSQPALLHEIVADISPALAQAVARALARDPAQRFPDCQSFAATALEGVRSSTTVAVPGSATPTSPQEVPFRPAAPRPAAVRLDCPMCQEVIAVPTLAAGKMVACPVCQARLFLSADCRALTATKGTPAPPPAPPVVAPPPPAPVLSDPAGPMTFGLQIEEDDRPAPPGPMTFGLHIEDDIKPGPMTFSLPIESPPPIDLAPEAAQPIYKPGRLGEGSIPLLTPPPMNVPSGPSVWGPEPVAGGKGLKVFALLVFGLLLLGGLGYGGYRAYEYLNRDPYTESTARKVVIPPPPKVKELVVGLDGKAPYRTIQKAIDDAPAGATIRIQPGKYQEHLVLTKAVTLQGEGKADDIILESEGTSCVTIKTDQVKLRGLSLRCKPKGEATGYALDIVQGKPEIEDCDISSTGQGGVRISGEQTDPVLRRCLIHDCPGTGLSVTSKAQGRFEECQFFGNEGFAVDVQEGANPTLRKCKLRNNKGGGLLVRQNSQGTLEDCTFADNAGVSVEIRERSKPTLKRCQIQNSQERAVLVTSRGQGLLEDVVIQNTGQTGVTIQEGGDPVLRGCIISQGKGAGVVIGKDGKGTLEDCLIEGSAFAGIELREGCQPRFRGCTVRNGQGTGLLCHQRAGGSLEKCRFEGNAGIQVDIQGQADPTLTSCKVLDGKQFGVFVHDDGKGTIDDCEIKGQALGGMVTSRSGNPKVFKCEIHDNLQGGIFVFDKGRGTFESCNVYANRLSGIEVKEGGEPVVTKCTFTNGQTTGVYVHTNGRGSFENCEITGNTSAGVAVTAGGDPSLTKCNISKGKYNGISLYAKGRGTFVNCDIAGNNNSGVQIFDSTVTLSHCTIHETKGIGIWFSNGGGKVDDCEVYEDTNVGIWIQGESQPQITTCKIHNAKFSGVMVEKKSRPVLADCEVYQNGLHGIMIRTEGDPSVRNCRFNNCKECGILVTEEGKGTFENCTLRGNTLTAVIVQNQSSVTLRRCTISGNEQWALWVHIKSTATVENCDGRENNKGAWFVDRDCTMDGKGNLPAK